MLRIHYETAGAVRRTPPQAGGAAVGETEDIASAYNQIVGKLKSKALPEYRKMQRIVDLESR